MITTQHHPDRDTVLYDGQCRFCRSQIALLRRLAGSPVPGENYYVAPISPL